MANSRAKDQGIDAFSAPKGLLSAAKKAAIKLRMTKSGFYRYALAHELGYSEPEALAVAEHLGVGNALAAMHEEYKPAAKADRESSRSPKADAAIGRKPRRGRGAARGSKSTPASPGKSPNITKD